jgi:hypothetical protein
MLERRVVGGWAGVNFLKTTTASSVKTVRRDPSDNCNCQKPPLLIVAVVLIGPV